jgi:hypothetical protein
LEIREFLVSYPALGMLVLQVVYPIYDVKLISCCFQRISRGGISGLGIAGISGGRIIRSLVDQNIRPLDRNLHIVIL